MRNLVLLALGIALGAMAASIALNALNRRDAYARGVMEVMQHQVGVLRGNLRTNACSAAETARGRALLAALTEEIEPSVFADAIADSPFREYAQRLRDAVADLPPAAAGCAALAPAVVRITDACDACHRQYR